MPKNRTLNNLTYSTPLIKICNEVIDNPSYDYFTDIKNVLITNTHDSVNIDNYVLSNKDILWKHTRATYLLYFYETCRNTESHIVPLDLTLEHIIPQKAKEPIINSKNIDKIGNLTLLEGKNSDKIGHKGNSSIQNKLYKDKLNSYKESSVKVTRELAVLHNAFSESTIQERSIELLNQLNENTSYFA